MRFTVVWKPSAVETPAALWMHSGRRKEVAAAADDIDALLRTVPMDIGEPGVLNSRILIRLPLAAVYDVRLDDRLVEVLGVVAVPVE